MRLRKKNVITQMMWWHCAITHVCGNTDCNDLGSLLLWKQNLQIFKLS